MSFSRCTATLMLLGAQSICCVTGGLPALAYEVRAGPVGNSAYDDAGRKCPSVCQSRDPRIHGGWTGRWDITVKGQGQELVCDCAAAAE
jgi:hypothetical protein